MADDPLLRYRAATADWRRHDAAARADAQRRAYAIADMVAAATGPDPVREVARRTGLSPASVERLLAKARTSLTETEGDSR